jgi:hypothetical protein
VVWLVLAEAELPRRLPLLAPNEGRRRNLPLAPGGAEGPTDEFTVSLIEGDLAVDMEGSFVVLLDGEPPKPIDTIASSKVLLEMTSDALAEPVQTMLVVRAGELLHVLTESKGESLVSETTRMSFVSKGLVVMEPSNVFSGVSPGPRIQ